MTFSLRSGLRILGVDPGLRRTGWGIIETVSNRLSFVACGCIQPDDTQSLAQRLAGLYAGLDGIIRQHCPDQAAVEETFVNVNAAATLKLGQARGVCLLVPALAGLPVAEYAPNLVKKSVVGAGKADKAQVQAMIRVLLPKVDTRNADAYDALAVAITHAHHGALHHKITRTAP
jgi:crossover junction endodeoxyribonuclease RuvC